MSKFTKHFVFLSALFICIACAFMTGLNSSSADTPNALIWGIVTIIIALSGYFVFINFQNRSDK